MRQTVLSIRGKLQVSAEEIQPEDALSNAEVETDEMFQNAGEKAINTLRLRIRRIIVVINGVDTALMTKGARLLLRRKVVKVIS